MKDEGREMIEIPAQNVEAFILELAATHGVRYVRGPYDDLAIALITRLDDVEAVMDDIENLLLALARAKVISTREMISLHFAYFREKFGRPNL